MGGGEKRRKQTRQVRPRTFFPVRKENESFEFLERRTETFRIPRAFSQCKDFEFKSKRRKIMAKKNFEFEHYFGAETRDQPLDKLLRTVSVVEILRTVFEFENLIYTKCVDIEVLKKIRTPVRRAATELSNSIKIEIEKENASSDLIEELLAKLIDKEKQLENVDKDITILTNMDDLEKEI
ncbi:uncharacterized protein TNCV_4560961 [Trichonephila clavipes]|nr:uncharacterized protein TNCV_4560961 [Trichonephila clavipes]